MNTDSTSRQPVVKLEDVSFSYDGEKVLQNASLTITEKEFVWVVGPNGGGKTTLIKIILGLLKPHSGSVSVFGESATEACQRIGYMPQHAYLDLRFPVTVLDIALMGRLSQRLAPQLFSALDRNIAMEALEEVGLENKANRSLSELSGGQQRRLLIARALASRPDLLLLDEPTANLDRQIEREFHDLLRRLNEHLTIIMVSHDPAFVSDFVESVVCVNCTVAVHPTTILGTDFMDELYGRHMRVVRHDRHDTTGGTV